MNAPRRHFKTPVIRARTRIVALSLGVLFAWVALPASGAQGDLDTNFNSTGLVFTNLGDSMGSPDHDIGFDVAVQSDGKLVVAGPARFGGNYDFGVARYNADGSLDTTFNDDGKVVTQVGSSDDMAYGVVLQADGKIIVVGTTYTGSSNDLAVARYTTAGVLDTTFSGDGLFTVDVGGMDFGRSAVVLGDGSILIGGVMDMSTNVFLVKLTSAGALDTSFDGDGKALAERGPAPFLNSFAAIAVQTDGKILLATDGGDHFWLARFQASGALDTSFDGDGIVTTAIGAYDEGRDILIQGDDKIVVAGRTYDGSTSSDFALVRYNTDGSIDTLFGSSGKAITSFGASGDEAYSVLMQSDGKLVAAGYSSIGSAHHFALARYQPNGALDTTFGTGGLVQTDLGSTGYDFYVRAGLAIQGDGKLVMSGYRQVGDRDFAVARYEGSPIAPEIAIEEPVGTGLTDGSTSIVFPTTAVGASQIKTFTVRNTGNVLLDGIAVNKTGMHATDFTVNISGMSSSLAPGASTLFSVTYNPSAPGNKAAAVHVTSNDADENPFDITLSGTATGTLAATYSTGAEVPVTSNGFTAAGSTVNFTLNFTPTPGTDLMVVNNTGQPFIQGTFSNLAQGQSVALPFGTAVYNFVANYYGGSGNDLVLVWAKNRLVAWGQNDVGQIGDGTVTSTSPNGKLLPTAVTSSGVLAGKTVIATSTGDQFSLALLSDGTVAAWGLNAQGQLGDNSVSDRTTPVLVNTASGISALYGKKVIMISAGANHSLALCSDGTLAAWGRGSDWKLGNGDFTDQIAPVAVNTGAGTALNGKTVIAVSAGGSHSLALCSDGTVAAWGQGGLIGDNTTTLRSSPTAVNRANGVSALFGKTVIAISAGSQHALALCSDGSLAAWGFNSTGCLGDNSTTNRLAPVLVNSGNGTSALHGKTVVAISAGPSHSLALCSDGTLASWGDNSSGALGDNSNSQRLAPVSVNQANGVSALFGKLVGSVYAKAEHSLAFCSDGSVCAWGKGSYGRLGDNSTTNRLVAVLTNTSPLLLNEKIVSISNGGITFHTLAIVASPPPPPTVATLAATSITGTSAVLNGTINANGSGAAALFDYGTTIAYGSTATGTPAVVTGDTNVAVAATVSGLQPGTLYHFRVRGTDTPGNDLTFTTLSADLANLTLSAGTLSPGFSSGTTSYTASVGHNSYSLSVTPTVAQANATITVNGSAVLSGNASGLLPLNVGANTITVVVTAPDGTTMQSYTLTVTRAAALPGDVEQGFNPNPDYIVYNTAMQPDGKILLGGHFGTAGGVARNFIARLNADGTLDNGFNPNADGIVKVLAVQTDGKIVIGGAFVTVGGVARNRIARLNPDGTLDSSFNPNANSIIHSVTMQADGKIIVGGEFTIMGGATRNRIARLNADGTLDSGFDPNANERVYTTALQADGKILIGGSFTTMGEVTRNYFARLNADGTLDSGFDPNVNGWTPSVAVQVDGKIVIGGAFTVVGGITRTGIARLNANGTLDTGFNPNVDVYVYTVTLQTDGKIVLGGEFPSLGTNYFTRLNADGTTDNGFNPGVSGSYVFDAVVQADGKLLLGGNFTSVGGVPRNYFVRLDNGAATQSLTVPSANRVQWLRGGTSPETHLVTFELSTDGGTNYSVLGTGSRSSGGWELTGLALPANGQIRARARTLGGYFTASSGLAEAITPFSSLAMPEIAVTGNSVDIADGDASPSTMDHTDFGPQNVSSGTVVRSYTIQNGGTGDLTLGAVTVGGTNAPDFTVTTPPASTVTAGDSTTFQVTFDPAALGPRSATLSFATNDFDENPFNFSIQGTGQSFAPRLFYYVNDSSLTNDNWCTSVGNDANDGLTPATPKATLQALLDAQDLEPGDVVYVDSGLYSLNADVTLGSGDSGNSSSPVTIRGVVGSTIFQRSGVSGVCFLQAGMTYVVVDGCEFRGGVYGFQQVTNGYTSTLTNNVFNGVGVNIYRGTMTLTNNTFWQCGYTADSGNNTVKNNIFVINGAGNSCVNILSSWASPPNYTNIYDYNCYRATGGATIGYPESYDMHRLTTDPRLVDPAGGDFHLQSTAGSWHGGIFTADAADSPCIDAGDPGMSVGAETTPNGGRINLGAFGGTIQAARTPSGRVMALNVPNGSDVWVGNQVIRWNVAGAGWLAGDTVHLEVSTDGGNTWSAIAGAESLACNLGQFTWNSATASSGTLSRIRVVGNGAAAASSDQSDANFILHNTALAYYVNDALQTGDMWTSAPGNDANDGLTPATPKATLQALLDAHNLETGDVVYVDSGVYSLSANVMLGSGDSGDSISPVTLRGVGGRTIFQRSGVSGASIQQAGIAYVVVDGFEFRGGAYGVSQPSYGYNPVTLRNNAFNGVGVSIYRGTMTVINNTFWQCGYAADSSYNTLKNNIFVVNGAGYSCVSISGSWAPPTSYTNVYDYNCYQISGGAVIGYAESLDLHRMSTDPRLVDPVGGDFHLQSTAGSWHGGVFTADAADSPCIDAGDPALAVGSEPAPHGGRINLGAFGGTDQASKTPAGRLLLVVSPNGGESISGTTQVVRWNAIGQAWQGGDTVALEYSADGGGSWQPISGAGSLAYGLGQYSWNFSALSSGGYKLRVSYGGGSVFDASDGIIVVRNPSVIYYVNDTALTNDNWCTAPGNDANDGLTPVTPKLTVQSVVDSYDLEAGDVVRIDTGTYSLSYDIVVGGGDGGSSTADVIFEASPYGTVMDRVVSSSSNAYAWSVTASYFTLRTAQSVKYPGVAPRMLKLTYSGPGIGFMHGVSLTTDIVTNITLSGLEIAAKTNGIWARSTNVTVENCLIRGGTTGIYFENSTTKTVRNCTIAEFSSYGIQSDKAAAIRLNNCIVVADGGSRRAVYLNDTNAAMVSDYNCFVLRNGAAVGNYGAVRATLADWRTATGKDGNSIAQEPLFVNEAGFDYHLTYFSPCKNAGSNASVTGGSLDFDGQARSNGAAVDIGVDEYYGAPEIAVEQPSSNGLTDGVSGLPFGTVGVGSSSAVKTVTIRNLGSDLLASLAVSVSGTHPADFTVDTSGMSTSLDPGASTTFTVTFSPSQVGNRSAALQITSNDADENPFDITLTGEATGALTTNFTSGGDIPLTSNGFTAAGSTVNLSLGFAPTAGMDLTVVNNTSASPISGTFSNLAQGQTATLSFGGTDYRFFADYFGGDGNDLVLVLQGPGVLDYSFNASGKVKTAIGSGNEQAWDVAVQVDGKIVAAGWSHNGSSDDFAVVRYNADGSLDTGFGTGGKVTTSLGNEKDQAYGVEIQADGKIVVAGLSTNSGAQHVAVVRYNTNGTLDTGFDGDGKVVTPVGATSEGRDVVLQSDGKIVVGGDYWSGTDTDFILVRYNTNGSLDSSFGTGGIVTTTQAGRHDEATGVALAPDGKIVLGGYYQVNNDRVIELARYQANGAPDTTFSGDGIVTTQIGASDFGNDVVAQSDGKILLAGRAPGGGGNDAIVARYNSNGTLDTSFDNDGLVGVALGSYGDYAYSVAQQWNGKIILAGITEDGVAENFMLARLNVDGSLDTSFAGTGKVSTSFGATSYDHAYGMALQSDGMIVLAGIASQGGDADFAVTRYLVETTRDVTFASASDVPLTVGALTATNLTVNITLGFAPSVGTELRLVNNTGTNPITGTFTNLGNGAVVPLTYSGITYTFIASYTGGTGNDLTLTTLAGALDATFSTDGIVTTAVGGGVDAAYGMAVQSDGKIVAAGISHNGSNNDFAVVRYNADGTLDTTFNSTGKVVTPIGSGDDDCYDVAVQSDGKILAAGYSFNGSNLDSVLVRYNANGSLDTSFNGTGKVILAFGTEDDQFANLALQSDGKIVVTGYVSNGGNLDFSVARYNTNGTLDTSFNGTGKSSVDMSGGQDNTNDVLVLADGKILVAGTVTGGPFGMVRFNSNGSLDTSFGSAGKVITATGSGHGTAIALQSDGKILFAGYAGPGPANLMDFRVLRYDANGSLDTTFGNAGQVTTDFGGDQDSAGAIAVQSDGKIVAAGYSFVGTRWSFSAVRYNANGSLDTSFQGTGKLTIPVGSGNDTGSDMSIQSDGKIVIVGTSHNGSNNDFAVVRLLNDTSYDATFTSANEVPLNTNSFTATGQTVNITLNFAPVIGTELRLVNNTGPNPITGTFTNIAHGTTVPLTYNSVTYNFIANYTGGTGNDLTLLLPGPGALDYAFNGSGKISTAIGSDDDIGRGVAAQPDGKTVVVGESFNGSNKDFSVVRYNADGTPDPSFDSDGKVTTAIGSGNDVAYAVTTQPDGKIVVAGSSGADVGVLRYNANGSLDATFNGTGMVITSVNSGNDLAFSIAVQTDGKLLVAGQTSAGGPNDFFLLRYTNTGALDTSFNGTGKVTTAIGSGDDSAPGLALQSDGKILLAGYSHNGTSYDIALVRYNTDGSLDTSFNGTGKAITSIGSEDDFANAVAVQPDGRIVVGGTSVSGGVYFGAVLRYTSTGALDTTFNTTGKIVTNTTNGLMEDLALQSDGKILLAGHSLSGGFEDFEVLRFTTSGAFDTSFRGAGKVILPLSTGNDLCHAIALQPDGKIILAGEVNNGSNADIAAVRLLAETDHPVTFASASDVPLNANGFTATGQTVNISLGFAPAVGTELRLVNNTGANPITGTFTNLAHGATVPLTFNAITYNFIANYTGGTGNDLTLLLPGPGGLDYTFNGSGEVSTAIGSDDDQGRAVAVQNDGKIVAAGSTFNGTDSDIAVIRYRADGTPDAAFGSGGKVTTPVGSGENEARGIAMQPDGKIVVAGYMFNGSNYDIAVVRYNTNGTLDPGFGTGGVTTTAVGSGNDLGMSVALQADGKIIVAGYTGNGGPNDIAVVRYNPGGTLDTTFNGTGIVTTPIGSDDVAYSVAVQSDGKIVVAGDSESGGNRDFAVARYNANGTLDTSFNGTGKVTTPIGTIDTCRSVVVQRDGKIVAAGWMFNGSTYNFVLVRYNTNGTLDSTFDTDGKVVTLIGSFNARGNGLAVQADGRLVVAGFANINSDSDFAAARYNTDGSLDTTFKGSGTATTNIGTGDDFGYSVAVQPDGRIVLAGYVMNGGNDDFACVRYLGDSTHEVVFNAATNVPLSFNGLNGSGQTLYLTLNFMPNVGTSLKVFDNTSLQPISGEFSNLAHGQTVTLSYNSVNYNFVANYFGGDGNDLTLEWANTKLAAFGLNASGQLGITGTAAQANVPTQVVGTAPIYQKTILSMSAGESHSLAVCSDGTVAAWGSNANGQLGNGTTTSAATPVAVTMGGVLNGKKVIVVAAGGQHSMALCSDGTLAAWGDGSFGQIGDNGVLDRMSPVLVSTSGALNGRRVIAISAGANHSAALCSDGTVVCWGGNTNGELGNSSNTPSSVPVAVTTSGVLFGRTVTAVACGQNHTLALLADGSVVAWGLNASGQLGNNSTTASNVPAVVDASGSLNGKRVVQIAAGGQSSLAQCSDGILAAWGLNDHGQLGVNSATTTFGTPQAVSLGGVLSGKTISGLQMGQTHAAVVCTDGTMASWGAGSGGQLGNSAVLDSLVPVAVNSSILGGADVFVSAGGGAQAGHTLAVIGAGVNATMIAVEHESTVLADNAASGPSYGGLLIGSTRTKVFVLRNTGTQTLSGLAASLTGTGVAHYAIDTQPATSLAPGEATSVMVSFNPVSFGAKEVVLRIASNLSGDLNPFETKLSGTGDPELYATWVTGNEIPAQAAGFDASGNEIILSLGFAPPAGTTLMVLNNTSLAFTDGFFDSSEFGQFAHGQEVELEYNGVFYTFVVNYFGGDGNDIVLQWAGTRMLAWGANTNGSLGNGLTANSSLPVVVNMSGVLNGKRIIAAASALRHSLALCSDGTLASWGNNGSGQLGNAGTTTAHSSVPVLVNMSGVLLGKTPVAIAAGNDFSVVLCSDGTVATWGLNADGQLGTNSTTNSNVPVLVDTAGALAGKIVTAIAAGSAHVLVRCSDGTLYAWGSNSSGQLGDNSTTPSLVPVAVAMSGVLSGKQVTRLAAGYFHSLVSCSDGTLAAWGDNAYGMIGNGTSTASLVPVQTDPGAILGGKLTAQQGAGQFHSVWLGADGTLAAWGRNNSAQLGVSTTTLFSLSPLIVSQSGALAGKTAAFLANGRQHQVVLLTDGTLAAWGLGGSGQLGNGATSNSVTPVAVSAAGLVAGERVMRVYSGTGSAHNISLVAQPVTQPGGPPVVSTNPATAVDKTTVTLNGLVSPNSLATDARFEYGLTTGYGTQTAIQSLGSGSTSVSVTQNLAGLEPNTTYHFRVTATNSGGAANGSDLTFTTLVDPPVAVNGTASGITNTGATLNGSVNPNTRATTVFFRVSTDPAFATNTFTTAPQNVAAGSGFVSVSAPLSGLLFGTTYHYRLVAQNTAGEAEDMAAQNFTTTSVGIATQPPTISGTTALNITTTSARLQGSVNPNGGLTNVFFEYGPAPSFGTNSINYSAGSGTSPQTMTHDISGLLPATQYQFRLVAENNFNNSTTTTGATITFTTLPLPPIVETLAATPLSTTSARLNATVRAQNGTATVTFEWGTNGVNFPNSLTATPSPVTGDAVTNVSGDLTNLLQFTTYHFRVRAVSSGGNMPGGVLTFQPQVISGLLQQFPNAPPASNGSVTVTLNPTGTLTGWRFVGEQQWRTSGSTASGLTLGSRTLEFRPVPGYIQPAPELVTLTEGSTSQVLDLDYYVTAVAGTGSIQVVLKPDSLAQAALVSNRSQWRLLGEDNTQWRDSGAELAALPAGVYLVESKPLAGYSTPAVASVTVTSDQVSNPTLVYFTASSPTGLAPQVLTFNTVFTDTTKPYAYVGQIRSNAGLSTGFIVKPRVVATAAHVVWDDGTLSAAQGVQWLFQRDAGTHDPVPLIPHGFYTFDGYAAQRIADASPGQSSPQSQHLDVAAIYFNENAGRDGFSGWLASDLTNNEFLLSGADKMLVGYPIDNIDPAFHGRMHATAAANISFTGAFGRTFTTNGLHSFGGNSGGPLCVLHTNGQWYPSAIYLGGTNQTVVRAIDSEVIDLFNRAETSSTGGGNNTGGGITHTGYTSGGSASTGALRVNIPTPGAGWRLVGSTKAFRPGGYTLTSLTPGFPQVEFTPVAGYQTPAHQNVQVIANSTQIYSIEYLPSQTPQETWRQTYFGSTANSGNAADDFDFDGDGFTNAEEYTAGTNPTLSGEFFKANNPQRSGNTFSVNTAGKAGRSYVLERSTTLGAGSWTTVDTESSLAADGPVTLTDAASPPGAAFYRIQVTGP